MGTVRMFLWKKGKGSLREVHGGDGVTTLSVPYHPCVKGDHPPPELLTAGTTT